MIIPESLYKPVPTIKLYSMGFMFNDNGSKVLLIQKTKPLWMKGRLNAIGGKIEPNETPMKAMIREFREEVGVSFIGWTPYGQLSGTDPTGSPYIVYLFCASSDPAVHSARSMEEEPVFIQSIHNTENYMPNLNWLKEMAWTRLFNNDNCKYHSITEVTYESSIRLD